MQWIIVSNGVILLVSQYRHLSGCVRRWWAVAASIFVWKRSPLFVPFEQGFAGKVVESPPLTHGSQQVKFAAVSDVRPQMAGVGVSGPLASGPAKGMVPVHIKYQKLMKWQEQFNVSLFSTVPMHRTWTVVSLWKEEESVLVTGRLGHILKQFRQNAVFS